MSLAYSQPIPGEREQDLILGRIGWRGLILILALAALGSVGVALLYSIEGMSWGGLAENHALRLGLGLALMLACAMTPISWWMWLAYPIYLGALALLVWVEVDGVVINEARRWIRVGGVSIQPSEIMKFALVFALARYYHGLSFDKVRHPLGQFVPLLLIAAPAVLVARQPDLGTALLLVAGGGALIFLSGVRWSHILAAAVPGALAVYWVLISGLKPYQRERITTFMSAICEPGADVNDENWNICQSIIAIGSGGVSGKGWGDGTQSQLRFIPELETDFIFPVLAEEFGFYGTVSVLSLAYLIIALTVIIGLTAATPFGRMLAMGVAATFALYVMVNVAMVTGLIPVVGVPFPLVSNGGTVMLVALASFGIVLSAQRHVETKRGPTGGWAQSTHS